MAVASALAVAVAVAGQTPAFAVPDVIAPPFTACAPTPAVAPALVAATGSAAGIHGGVLLAGRQVDAAATIVNVGLDAGVTRRGIAIAIAAAMQSSSLDPGARNGVHLGLFQQRTDATSGLYTEQDRRDAVGSAQMFYAQLAERVPGYDTDPRSNADLADLVQESGDLELIAAWSGLADALVDHFIPIETPVLAPASRRRGVGRCRDRRAPGASRRDGRIRAADPRLGDRRPSDDHGGTVDRQRPDHRRVHRCGRHDVGRHDVGSHDDIGSHNGDRPDDSRHRRHHRAGHHGPHRHGSARPRSRPPPIPPPASRPPPIPPPASRPRRFPSPLSRSTRPRPTRPPPTRPPPTRPTTDPARHRPDHHRPGTH